MKLVDFVIGGAQKSGTSALYSYLKEHPQIFMPDIKELHFFDLAYSHKRVSCDKYLSYFHGFEREQVIGEATPIYMYWSPCAERIQKYNPNMKWIVILRNPIERAFSHWNMEFSKRNDTNQFFESLLIEIHRLKKFPTLQNRVISYISRGYYSNQIQNLWNLFGEKNVCILRYDDLLNGHDLTLKKVFNFLEVSIDFTIDQRIVYKIDYSRQIFSYEKELLTNIFQDEITSIENMLGWNCEAWRT